MSFEMLTDTEPLGLHTEKIGLTVYILQNNKLDEANWATSRNILHITYWKNICILHKNKHLKNDVFFFNPADPQGIT